jgi:iron complex outermembrane recepter protein
VAARQRLSLSGSLARTTRFATLRERFSDGLGFREPNPALGPEAGWSGTVEARWAPVERLELLLLGGHSAVDGLIAQVTLPNGLTQWQNVAQAQLSSGELKAGWTVHDWVRLELGVMALRAVQVIPGGQRPLEYRAPVQGVASVRFAPRPWLVAFLGVQASGERPFVNPLTRKDERLPGFADVSLRVEWTPLPALTLWARGTNLFDASVDSQYGFPRPGRQLFLGASMQVDQPPSTE